MRRIILALSAIVLGGIMMTACQKENLADIPEGAIRLTTEGFHNDGKTMVNDLSVFWADGDNVVINGSEYTVTVSGDQAYIDGSGITAPLHGYYGIPEWSISNGTTTTPTVYVPSSYTVAYDAAGNQIINLPMVAYNSTLGSAIQFKHVTAAIQVLVRNEIEGTTLVLDRVVVRSSTYRLSGSVTLTLNDNAAPTMAAQSGSGEVSVSFTGSPTIPYYNPDEDNYLAVQVPILPVGEGDITVEVYTHADNNSNTAYIYSNTATIGALARNDMLTAGCRISGTSTHVTADYPLTFEAKSANSTVNFINNTGASIEYSVNGGTWASCASSGTTSVTLERADDKVSFRGNNTRLATTITASQACRFEISTGECYVYGNIMSLLNSAAYGAATTLEADYTFANLFYNNANLYSHPTQHLVLPATSLKLWCYYSMFKYCTNLTSAPALPATSLSDFCYQSMFHGCTNLTSAPALPATSLMDHCYHSMFQDCTSLESAPVLPATTLKPSCYSEMFSRCSRLHSITCLATDIPAQSCCNRWVIGVYSGNGTFTKAASMNDWPTGVNGIPNGWTVEDASSK